MNEKMKIDVPHRLGKQEAKTRLDTGFARLQQEIAGKPVKVEQSWNGDTMDFRAGVLGQAVSGRLSVDEDRVHIEIDMPWLLAKLAGGMKERLTKGARLLLEKK